VIELIITMTRDVIRKPDETNDKMIKNFEKKPASGGIPAIENNVKAKVATSVMFF